MYAKIASDLFDPLCLGALLMECEQRGSIDYEMAILSELESTADNHGIELGFRTATKHVANMCFSKSYNIDLVDSGCGVGDNREPRSSTLAGIWHARGG